MIAELSQVFETGSIITDDCQTQDQISPISIKAVINSIHLLVFLVGEL
jgi:hypothetical protein